LIFNFLAILEMLSLGQLSLQIGEGYNNFWVTMRDAVEAGSN
jgi:segregation and condensation protein A